MKLKRTAFPLFILLGVLSLLLAACSPKQPSATPTIAAGGYPAPSISPQITQESYPSPAQSTGVVPTSIQAAYPSPPSGGATPVQIVKADGTTTSIDETSLQGLTVTQVTIANATRNGFKLSDVLQKAGVADYQQVIVTGSTGSQTLSKDQVNADAILSFDPVGTAELSGANLPQTQWVTGVTKIEVK